MNALAEPNRLRIVELLRSGPLTVGEIAERLGLRQPQTSKHLHVLCEAGLVEIQAVANRRICKLRPQPLIEMNSWLETFRRVTEDTFDRLDRYLNEQNQMQEGGKNEIYRNGEKIELHEEG